MMGHRKLHVRLKTAKGRTVSSSRWLQRQLNDPYVSQAKREGYRSRSAFKLVQLNQKFNCLKPGMNVLDLGCAPGGWSQVAAQLTNSAGTACNLPKGKVFAVDINPIDPIIGVEFVQRDAFELDTSALGQDLIKDKIDGTLSDMASPATGHKQTDHLRIVALCELAFDLAKDILLHGGFFIAKVLEGGADHHLQRGLKQSFERVYTYKPGASRKESSEKYVVCLGFRG